MKKPLCLFVMFFVVGAVNAADKWEYLTLGFVEGDGDQTWTFQINGVQSQFLKMPKFVNDPNRGADIKRQALAVSIKGKKTLPIAYHIPELFNQNIIKIGVVLNMLGRNGWEMVNFDATKNDGQDVSFYVFKRKLTK